MRLSLLVTGLVLLGCFTKLYAEWAWIPEIGWVNDKYDARAMAQTLYSQAKKFMEQKQYKEAVSLFLNIVEQYPNIPESKESLHLLAECHYASASYYEAYFAYEAYLQKYPDTPQLSKVIAREYQIGIWFAQNQDSPDTTLGLEILQKVIKSAPYADFADDAQFAVALCYFGQQAYPDAETNFSKLIQQYPQSEWRPTSQYYLGLCAFRQFRGIDYDREFLVSAQARLKEYITKYPEGAQIDTARQTYQEVREMLARKELMVAFYYLDRDKSVAATVYLQNVVREYADTKTALLAKAKLREVKPGGQ